MVVFQLYFISASSSTTKTKIPHKKEHKTMETEVMSITAEISAAMIKN